MTKKLNSVFIALTILLFSCSESNSPATEIGKTESKKTTLDTVISQLEVVEQIDSTINIDFNMLIAKVDNDTIYHVPFHLDSLYMTSLTEINESTLTNAEVQYLSANLIDNTPTNWASNSINSFIEIDSMKLMGTYEDYVDNLDIGMMKESDANILQKVVIDENNYILLWSITYSTYEACPYASGTDVFGTYFKNQNAINTAALGEDSGGGDAPYWGSTFTTSQINSTFIVTKKHDESGGENIDETGEDIIDITDEMFKIEITESGFEVVKSK